MKQKDNDKEKIVEILFKHPEGLSINEISDYVGSHRHTVNKYIHELIGAGIVHQRDFGIIKLHYLSVVFGHNIPRKTILEKIKRQIK